MRAAALQTVRELRPPVACSLFKRLEIVGGGRCKK